jgi:putative PIN family toxin of toxin-antitoxin system
VPARITPDSNILISALVFGGTPLRLLEMALGGEVLLFISDEILQETLRVLRDKFGLSQERLARAEHYIGTCTERVKPSRRIDIIKDDPDDNRVLECAEASTCEFIVTGDSDLLRLGKYGSIRITTVRSFLDRT